MIHKNIFYGWWILGACMVMSFYIAGTTAYGFTAMFEPLIAEFGWNYTQISIAASLRGMEMGIFAPLVGWLVDRYGPRRLLFWGVPIMSCGFFMLATTQNLLMFYVSMFILSIGKGACASVVTMTAVANWFHQKIGLALGILTSGFGLSGLAVPVIVWLIDSYGWRAALVILGVSTLVIGIPLAMIVRNRPEEIGSYPDGVPPAENVVLKADSAEKEAMQKKKGFYRESLRDPAFLILCAIEIIRICIMSSVMIHIMPYLASRGIERTTAGLIAGAIPLVSVVGRFSFGWLSDTVPKRWLMGIVLCLTSAGLVALNFVSVAGVLFVFLILFPVGTGGGMVLRGTIVREYFGRHNFGKIVGMVMGISAWGGVVGPTAAGLIFDLSGSYSSVWISLAVLMGLTTVLVRFFKAPESKT